MSLRGTGNGYVALWSWRPTTWRPHAPSDTTDHGLNERFDLQALGGPDNVWVTEVGRATDWSSAADPFAAFVAAITSAPVSASPIGGAAYKPADGFDLQYKSPTRGTIGFGWNAPFTVNGNVVNQHDYPRWSSPWSQVPGATVRYCVAAGGTTLDLDFTALVANTTFAASGTPCAVAVVAAPPIATAPPTPNPPIETPTSSATPDPARAIAVAPAFTG